MRFIHFYSTQAIYKYCQVKYKQRIRHNIFFSKCSLLLAIYCTFCHQVALSTERKWCPLVWFMYTNRPWHIATHISSTQDNLLSLISLHIIALVCPIFQTTTLYSPGIIFQDSDSVFSDFIPSGCHSINVFHETWTFSFLMCARQSCEGNCKSIFKHPRRLMY